MEGWLVLHASVSFPQVPSSETRTMLDWIKARFLSFQTEMLPLIVEAEMMGRIVKGRRMKDEVRTIVGSHCTVQSSYQLRVTRQPCFISQRHFVSLSEMRKYYNFYCQSEKYYWKRKEKLRNKILIIIFADFTDWKSDHFLCSMWQFSES